MTKLGVSVITMNPLDLAGEVEIISEIGGIDYLHIDVMDGHYVPRLGLYPEIVRGLSKLSDLKIDVHLMVNDVEFIIDQFTEVSTLETISFHYFQNEGRVFKIIDKIKDVGAKPIIAVDLSTNIDAISDIINYGELDGILFMGIHPGVLKQIHRPEIVLEKLLRLNSNLNHKLDDLTLQIDGAFNFDTAKPLRDAGINSFVGGTSSIYKNVSGELCQKEKYKILEKNIYQIRSLIK
jgi:ribulose-phosphate 3-epimerase